MVADDPDFVALFEREYAGQVRTAYLILGDEGLAREVAQEAFARALARWRRLKGYDRPGAWVRLVTVRLALRTRDRRSVEQPASARADEAPAVDHPADLDLVRAVRALPERQRAAVVLHYHCDLPVDEVAAILRITPSTTRVHLHQARARLADLLGEETHDAPT
jgi:RNA polymerase sigma factor (sigma-70 family)